MLDLAVNNVIILSSHLQYRPSLGAVGVRDGRIEFAGSRTFQHGDAKELVDGRGKILMPGLINAHCHGDMAFAKGLGDGMALQEQLGHFGEHHWFLGQLTLEDRYFARKHTYAEALLGGTTCIMENMFWGLGALSQKAVVEMGIRAALAEDVRFDFSAPNALLSAGQLGQFRDSCKTEGIIPVLGSVSEEDFSGQLLERISILQKQVPMYLTCHLAETDWRVQSCLDRMGMRPVLALERYGLVSNRLLGSHGVWLSPEEIEVLAAHKASVVSTPLCELKIADGLAPIPMLLKAGVNVALGTDGAMWNNSNDMFREMKCTALAQCLEHGPRALDHRQVLDMATINGARALGLADRVGTIEQGKLADFILIHADAPHMGPLRFGKWENISSAVVYCATGRDVSDVFVGGQRLVADGKLVGVDLQDIQRRVAEVSNRVAEAYC